jgi:hypothetical protein
MKKNVGAEESDTHTHSLSSLQSLMTEKAGRTEARMYLPEWSFMELLLLSALIAHGMIELEMVLRSRTRSYRIFYMARTKNARPVVVLATSASPT